jgi:sugar/nucleoside kinase (ribokinase family)
MLCGSYVLPRFGPAEALPYATALRARGQLVAFDPSWDPAGWSEANRAATLALLPEVDVYIPNEPELLHLIGKDCLDNAIAVVAALAGEVIVKRGADGAVYACGDERISSPGFPIDAVNTIGAGDVFDAGYLYARRIGWPPVERLRFANALAAQVVSQRGARTYPDAESVLRFMREHDDANRSHA